MTRHLWLALPLALLSCAVGGSGEDPGGAGGSLCVDTKDKVLSLMATAKGATSGPGLWRDQSRPKLGAGLPLPSQIVTVNKTSVELRTQAGNMTFDFGGAIPDGFEAGPAFVYQREGWDYVESGDLTLAVYWASTDKVPSSVTLVEDGKADKTSFTKIELPESCTADADCGELSIKSVVVDGDSIFPGYSREVSGWTVANRGVATGPQYCDAQAVTLITAWRKAAAE
jgi:hypothetical protein